MNSAALPFVAQQLVDLLNPGCERIIIAGSIRRRSPCPGDIELVAIPKVGTAAGLLFDSAEECLLTRTIDEATAARGTWLKLDVERPANGDRYKRLRTASGAKVDLFIVRPPASWGALLALRTGPADFSKLLVTSIDQGGVMPRGLRQSQGALWSTQGRIRTNTEQEYFAALGIPCWEPHERTAARLKAFLNARKESAHACAVTEER